MAKITGPLFSMTASGSIAGALTFQPEMGGGTCRRMPTAKPKNTPGQLRRQRLIAVPKLVLILLTPSLGDIERNGVSLGDRDAEGETILNRPDRYNELSRMMLAKNTGTLDVAYRLIQDDGGVGDLARQWFYAQTSGEQDGELDAMPVDYPATSGPYETAATAILLVARHWGAKNTTFEAQLPEDMNERFPWLLY